MRIGPEHVCSARTSPFLARIDIMPPSLFVLIFLLLGQSAQVSADPEVIAQVRADEKARVELISQLTPSVVCLFVGEDHAGGGSGVIIDEEGHGLTNFHVVAPMLPDRKGEAGLADGRLFPIEVLGTDPGGDLAMFRIVGQGPFQPVPLGDSESLQVGQYSLALGNPFGLAEDYRPSVSFGIISGLHRYQAGVREALLYSDCIQIDTSINPGNSGGPLFDMAGRLIGINGRVAIEERGRVNVGVGFAIPIDQIKRFIPALRAGLHTPRADAGLTVTDTKDEVVVSQLKKRGAAEAAGIKLGDVLIQFDGQAIDSVNRLVSIVGGYPGNWPVEIVFKRHGKKRSATMRLGSSPLPNFFERQPRQRKAPDPYGPHAITRAAQQRSIRRARASYRAATQVNKADSSLYFSLERRIATSPNDAPRQLTLQIDLSSKDAQTQSTGYDAIVRAIIEQLLRQDETEPTLSILRADEVRGRIGVVLEGELPNDQRYQVVIDDQNGDLLRIAFKDAESGNNVVYEYGAFRSTNNLRWPHSAWIHVNDVPYAQDTLTAIHRSSK